jgi:chemotaxis signal transduction protein
MPRAFVAIELGGAWLAIDADRVEEVVGPRTWTPLPGASARLPGAMSWRGGAIAVLDIGALTGLAPALRSAQERRRTCVLRHGDVTVAVPVEVVREALYVGDDAISSREGGEMLGEQVQLGDQMMPVLALGAALSVFA